MTEPAAQLEPTPDLRVLTRPDRYPYTQEARQQHNAIAKAIAYETHDRRQKAPTSIPWVSNKQAPVATDGILSADEHYMDAMRWASEACRAILRGSDAKARECALAWAESMQTVYRLQRTGSTPTADATPETLEKASQQAQPVITYSVRLAGQERTFEVDWGQRNPDEADFDLMEWAKLRADRDLREIPNEMIWRYHKGSLVLRDWVGKHHPHLVRALERIRVQVMGE